MDVNLFPVDFLSVASLMLLLLLNSQHVVDEPMEVDNEDEESLTISGTRQHWDGPTMDEEGIRRAVMQHFRIWNSLLLLDEELGFWVKPRSTTWFSKFLLEEYDDSRWVQMFWMTKQVVHSLSQLLSPSIRKRDTNYRLAIPAVVRVACTLFKLSHGVTLLICNELFAVGRSSVSMMLRDIVHSVNTAMRAEISWPRGQQLNDIAAAFQQLSGLPGVVGAIDGTHIAISKPRVGAPDYFYFKSGGYSIQCQVVVDSSKRFLDLNVGMPGSTNDSRVLRRSALFHRGQQRRLWEAGQAFQGFSPYLVGDYGFPLLSCLLVPHRRDRHMGVAAALFNRRLSKARVVVENAFALLKQTFRELHMKSELNVCFLPDVVTACAILHNVLMQQCQDDVERLLQVLNTEGCAPLPHVYAEGLEPVGDGALNEAEEEEGLLKRHELGIFLSLQRLAPT